MYFLVTGNPAFLYIASFACNLLQNVKLYLVFLKRYNPFPLKKLNENVIWKEKKRIPSVTV